MVASAETIGASSGATAGGSAGAGRRTPVAQEVAVVATGARPGTDASKRELFTENTSTALVFPNGGVIALSAAVEPGQLLFLTNQRTQQEVVAQVTRKRTNPATGYYVELEFTEPAPDFWGIAFPEVPEAAPDPQRPTLAELLQAAEPGANDLSPNAPAPSASAVRALVAEVEALRAQLQLIQSQGTGGNAAGESAALAAPPSDASKAPATPASDPVVKLAPALSAVLASMAASAGSAPPSAPGTAMPGSGEATALTAEDENLLPKPALDFQKAPKPNPQSSGRGGADRLGSLRLALLAVVSVFAVMVAAWNMHWLPWLSAKRSVADHTPATTRPGANAVPARPAAPPTAEAHPNPSSAAAGQSVGSAPKQDAATLAPARNAVRDSAATTPAEPAAPPDAAAVAAEAHERPAAVTPVVKRAPVHPSAAAEPPRASAVASPVDDASTTPPRLIKSARAVAPSRALREFMTGNVTLDALIDKSGEVKDMKVLSGPAIFHKAAMEALKKYRYEPARRNGQAVAAHVTVTIPFWFEP